MALPAHPCSWVTGYFYQVTRLRGTVVGAKIGPVQYVRWLRQSFARNDATLTLYEYRWPIDSLDDMPLVKSIRTNSDGHFDFGDVAAGHYTLIIEDKSWRWADWFDLEITNNAKRTGSITIDISPHFPDCKGGHEFIVKEE